MRNFRFAPALKGAENRKFSGKFSFTPALKRAGNLERS